MEAAFDTIMIITSTAPNEAFDNFSGWNGMLFCTVYALGAVSSFRRILQVKGYNVKFNSLDYIYYVFLEVALSGSGMIVVAVRSH